MTSDLIDTKGRVAGFLDNLVSSTAGKPVALTGPAGVGKSTLAAELAQRTGRVTYSMDYRFIGDSSERRALLDKKRHRSVSDYRDGANQFNWWDWSRISDDVSQLANGVSIKIDGAYDRRTGASSGDLTLTAAAGLIVEGAILGPPELTARFAAIIFLVLPIQMRFQRLVQKDRDRRSFEDIVARFLVTEYSETLYYRNLIRWTGSRLTFVDAATYQPVAPPTLPRSLYIPVPIDYE